MRPDTKDDDRAGDAHRSDGPDGDDLFAQVPELPSGRERWTARRKAAIIKAVRDSWVPIEEVCRLYSISVDEFLAWERDLDRNGVPGLRTTRYQIYRDTEPRERRAPPRK